MRNIKILQKINLLLGFTRIFLLGIINEHGVFIYSFTYSLFYLIVLYLFTLFLPIGRSVIYKRKLSLRTLVGGMSVVHCRAREGTNHRDAGQPSCAHYQFTSRLYYSQSYSSRSVVIISKLYKITYCQNRVSKEIIIVNSTGSLGDR